MRGEKWRLFISAAREFRGRGFRDSGVPGFRGWEDSRICPGRSAVLLALLDLATLSDVCLCMVKHKSFVVMTMVGLHRVWSGHDDVPWDEALKARDVE